MPHSIQSFIQLNTTLGGPDPAGRSQDWQGEEAETFSASRAQPRNQGDEARPVTLPVT